MLNSAVLMGRLTSFPELKQTNNGVSVCSFSIACQRDYSKDGQRETDFIDIVAWRGTAEFITRFFKKGEQIAIQGRIETGKYTDKNGISRKQFVVVAESAYFADTKKDNKSTDETQIAKQQEAPANESLDEDLPF